MDERLRRLERRWRESNSVDDHAALIREQVRQGALLMRKAILAGRLGHQAAKLAIDPPGWVITSKLMDGHDSETQRLITLVLLCTHTHPRDIPEDWHRGRVDYQTHDHPGRWVEVRWGERFDPFGVGGILPATIYLRLYDHYDCTAGAVRGKRFTTLLTQALVPWLLGGELGSPLPELITEAEVHGWMEFAHVFHTQRLVDAGLLAVFRFNDDGRPYFKRQHVKGLHAIVGKLSSAIGLGHTEILELFCGAMIPAPGAVKPRRLVGVSGARRRRELVDQIRSRLSQRQVKIPEFGSELPRHPGGELIRFTGGDHVAGAVAYALQTYLRDRKEAK